MDKLSVLFGIYVGGFVGLIAAAIGKQLGQKRRIRERNEYDERQKLLQSSVSVHTLVLGGVLLLLTGILSGFFDQIKISIMEQNLFILFLCASYFILEAIWRGAYFTPKLEKKNLYLYILITIVYGLLALSNIMKVFSGKLLLVKNGELTGESLVLIILVWVFVLFSGVLLGFYKWYKKNDAE